jgi:outer membrane phospholipase A
MDKIYSASQLSVSSYQNRKGEKKYQITINKELLEKLLENDKELIDFIRMETKLHG